MGDGRPLISFGRWGYFTERESYILKQRVVLDDPQKYNESEARLRLKDIFHFMAQPKKWFHIFITMSAVCAVHSLMTYSPRILRTSGFSITDSNALFSVAPYSAMFFNFALAFSADQLGHTSPFVLFAVSWNVIAYSCGLNLASYSKWQRYAVLVIAGIPYSSVQ